MEIRILGAHSQETATTRLTAVLVDGVLALDAGALTSTLTYDEQRRVQAVLLTHVHFDHLRDVLTLGFNLQGEPQIQVFGLPQVIDVLENRLADGTVYSHLSRRPTPEHPALRYEAVEPFREFAVAGYRVLPVPMEHVQPAVGYQVTSAQGRSVFFGGDGGPGNQGAWAAINPDLLILETSVPNRLQETAQRLGHLTPALLKDELVVMGKLWGRVPPVVLVHLPLLLEEEIAAEVAQVARELQVDITLGYEGRRLNL